MPVPVPPLAAYTHLTLSSARTLLASRLSDPLYVYWSPDELTALLQESLRTWQALTAFYRTRISIPLTQASPQYDLLAHSLFAPTVTDSSLISVIQEHLLERVPTQFTQSQYVSSLQRRRDQLMIDTACTVGTNTFLITSTQDPLVILPDYVAEVLFAFSINSSNVWRPLFRDDDLSTRLYLPRYMQVPGVTSTFSRSGTVPNQIRIYPPPSTDINLFLFILATGPDLTGVGSTLRVFDTYSPAIKWGAMADLLSQDGSCRDPQRAAYCWSRYTEMVEAIRINPVATGLFVGDVPADLPSLDDLQHYLPNWKNISSATPQYVTNAGKNLIVSNPLTQSNQVTLDVVAPIPIPLTDGEYLQVGREYEDTILDYAQHLACFKMGGSEFMNSLPLYSRFLRSAVYYNSRLNGSIFLRRLLESPSTYLFNQSPRDTQPPDPLPASTTTA